VDERAEELKTYRSYSRKLDVSPEPQFYTVRLISSSWAWPCGRMRLRFRLKLEWMSPRRHRPLILISQLEVVWGKREFIPSRFGSRTRACRMARTTIRFPSTALTASAYYIPCHYVNSYPRPVDRWPWRVVLEDSNTSKIDITRQKMAISERARLKYHIVRTLLLRMVLRHVVGPSCIHEVGDLRAILDHVCEILIRPCASCGSHSSRQYPAG